MQITTLRVAAKPQQFLKRFLFSNPDRLPASPSEPWKMGGENTYIGPGGLFCCWGFFFKPGAKIPKFLWGEAEMVAAGRLGPLGGSKTCWLLWARGH